MQARGNACSTLFHIHTLSFGLQNMNKYAICHSTPTLSLSFHLALLSIYFTSLDSPLFPLYFCFLKPTSCLPFLFCCLPYNSKSVFDSSVSFFNFLNIYLLSMTTWILHSLSQGISLISPFSLCFCQDLSLFYYVFLSSSPPPYLI